MTNILDLDNWNVLNTNKADVYEIEAEYTIQPNSCLKCGVIGKLYRHGTKVISYWDSPIRGLPVRLLARAQRYKCRECSETFIQPLGNIYQDMRMTQRCVEYIQSQCLLDTFVRISDHIGCDDKTIRAVAHNHMDMLNKQYKPYLPEWLGIDETKLDGAMRCVITDVCNRNPIDMLVDRDKPSVVAWLSKFHDKTIVRGLAIDMWRPYKDAAQSVFPGLPVVIDKFHVVRMANDGLEKVRIRLGKAEKKAVSRDWMRRKTLLRLRHANLNDKQRLNLDMWLKNEPEIEIAYNLKESFYKIYDCLTKETAAKELAIWRASVPPSMKGDFKELIRATGNWQEEILAYFDYPISNGYTEALNGIAKQINRAGRGYSFDVIRARILFKNKRNEPLHTVHEVKEPEMEAYIKNYAHSVRQMLLSKYECRCQSCLGVFSPENLYVTRMGAVIEGEPIKNRTILCATCKERFHTEGSVGHDSVSTP